MTVWSLGLSLHPLVEGCCCGIGLIVRGVLICGEGGWQVVVGVVAARSLCCWEMATSCGRRVLGWVWARLRIEAVRFCWLARGGGGSGGGGGGCGGGGGGDGWGGRGKCRRD